MAVDKLPEPRVADVHIEAFNEPLINFELLEDYFGDAPGSIDRLLLLFETTSGPLVQKLAHTTSQRDSTGTCALAHELRGSCGNIGIERLAHIAIELETAAESLHWARVDTLQRHLTQAFSDTLRARTRV